MDIPIEAIETLKIVRAVQLSSDVKRYGQRVADCVRRVVPDDIVSGVVSGLRRLTPTAVGPILVVDGASTCRDVAGSQSDGFVC